MGCIEFRRRMCLAQSVAPIQAGSKRLAQLQYYLPNVALMHKAVVEHQTQNELRFHLCANVH
jgi:hypothetical protein